MDKVPFVNLRHNLAPQGGTGHVYMPTSLLTAGSRAIQAGADIEFQDGNLHPLKLEDAETVGVSLIGSPYIPEVRRQIGERHRLILGGRVIAGLTQSSVQQFVRLFGMRAYNGNDDSEFGHALGVRAGDFPAVMETSLIPAYEKLSTDDLRAYLSTEFSFFLSRGCKKDCSFCPAERTIRDPHSGALIKMTEEYRDLQIVERDLRWLTEKALSFRFQQLEIYLCNLDLFQTPSKLREFAGIVLALKKAHPGFVYRLRGLSTTESFVGACEDHPEIVRAMVDAGLHRLGFGVDGDPAAEEVKRSIHKKFNTMENCVNAIRLAREHGITPETLMVFGHEEDTRESLKGAVRFTKRMIKEYGAIPRPHASKAFVPGNDSWTDPQYAKQIESLLNNPELFHNLDFTCEPSTLTHPDPAKRAEVSRAYRIIIEMPESETKITYPFEPEDPELTEFHKTLNEGRYDH